MILEPHPGLKNSSKAHRFKKCLVGEQFGRWKVLLRAPDIDYHIVYWCQCQCGFIGRVQKRSLASGKSRSCGCLKSELNRKEFKFRWENGFHKNGKLTPIKKSSPESD